MLQQESKLIITDNTGAKTAKIIRILGHSNVKYAYIGSIVVIAIKSAFPRGSVKKSSKEKAVIVRQKARFRRNDGSYISFDDNACVILENKEPKGVRIFGPIPRELRELGFKTIVSSAEEIV